MGQRVYWILLIVLFFSACLSACSPVASDANVVQAQLVKDDQLITKYIQNNKIDSAKVVDSSGFPTGIYYRIDTPGTGQDLFTSSTQITIAYTGWLLNANGTLGPVIGSSGTQFQPSFVLGSVLSGWEDAFLDIPKLGTGVILTLYLPSKYAYGPFPQPTLGLPANSVLIFTITLYNVSNN